VSINDFRDLEVWQRAMELQTLAFRLARRFPIEARFELGSQIRRAANSVVTNIVEGHGQTTRPNYRRYVGMARASNRELHAHLLSAVGVDYLAPDDITDATVLGERVGQMLTKLHDRLAPPEE
jgi:four helix bundle protein